MAVTLEFHLRLKRKSDKVLQWSFSDSLRWSCTKTKINYVDNLKQDSRSINRVVTGALAQQ